MIKILFICHGNISKSPEKACKISGSLEQKGACYMQVSMFLEQMLMCHKVTQKATDSRHNSVKIDT